jgi:dihydroorotase
VIDVVGLIVSPGFIDLHQHGQSEEAYRRSVRDGVTTSFELEVGTSDVRKWYADRDGGQLINHGVSIGHIPVRMAVMGDEGVFLPIGPGANQVATNRQVDEMTRRIREGLEQGAVAVGFGLAYTPAATPEELQALFKRAADYGASTHVHLRRAGTVEGLVNTIGLARITGTSLHVVHANSTGATVMAEFLELIRNGRDEGLDITTEAYPYEASASFIESALYADWEAWPDERFNNFQWPDTGERLTRETFARYREQGGAVINHARTEDMTRTAIVSPITMIASDGALNHPRGAGSYAKILGKYVREEGVLSLVDALRKMTVEPARRLQTRAPMMARKGRIRDGADADLTVFNPRTVIDQATYTDPSLPSLGIQYVLINGVVVVDEGELVANVKPGQPVRADST